MGLGGVGVTKTIEGIISRINYLLIGGARERKRYHRRFCLLTNFHDDTQNNISISLEHLQRPPHVFGYSIFFRGHPKTAEEEVSFSPTLCNAFRLSCPRQTRHIVVKPLKMMRSFFRGGPSHMTIQVQFSSSSHSGI